VNKLFKKKFLLIPLLLFAIYNTFVYLFVYFYSLINTTGLVLGKIFMLFYALYHLTVLAISCNLIKDAKKEDE